MTTLQTPIFDSARSSARVMARPRAIGHLLAIALAVLAAPALAAQGRAYAIAPAVPTPPAPILPAAPAAAPAPLARAFALAPALAWDDDALTRPSFQPRYPQDPADSLYREARTLLNRGEWRRAAALFRQVATRQPASAYTPDALYWQAFALYRIGGVTELREAAATLEARKSRFPSARNAEEADGLMSRVNGALAARGDAAATTRLREDAAGTGASCDSEELSVRASALSTLMRNDPEAATPILRRVLERRDACSVSLRRSAVLILGQRDDAAARATLGGVARNDPSPSVRADAIGFLAQADSDEMAGTLEAIVRADTVGSVQRSAVRALGEMQAPRAKAAIRALVERAGAPERLRLDAITSFDRRAAMSGAWAWSYACGAGECDDALVEMMRAGEAIEVAGVARAMTLAPPAPAAPVVPAVAPAPMVGTTVRSHTAAELEAREAARAEVRAATAEARAAMSRALAPEAALARGLARHDRRISAEDAAWLRGVYPRLESSRLKSAAATVLARAPDEATQAWLATLLQRDDEPAEVHNAVLVQLGPTMPIAQLARFYDGAPSRSTRLGIVAVLGERTEPEATDKLIEIVKTGTDPQLRRAAITALNGKKDPRTTKLLLELIDR